MDFRSNPVNQARHSKTLMRLSRISIERIPPDKIGVYAFWNPKNGKCIYVGKAEHQPIKERLRNHWRKAENEKLRLWIEALGAQIKICYLPLGRNKIDKYETRLIRAWNPEANIQKKRK